jgi:DNA-binding transcriptional LysR family regulator
MKPQINLLHLKYFCDAVTSNSVSEAAKKNYVTQSAVSQGIIKLEISIGHTLLVHSRQKFQLTEEGQIVFEQARRIFKSVDNIQEKINLNKAELSGSIQFACTNSLAMSYIAPSYKKMTRSFPHIPINFQMGNLNHIRNLLRQGDVEFAIVVYDASFSQFEKKVLKRGKFQLYCHKDSTLSIKENGILIDYLPGMYVQELFTYLNEKHHTSFSIRQQLAGWEVIARFVEVDLGIGFFPDYLMQGSRYSLIKNYPEEIPNMEYEICAIYNKGDYLSRATLAFLETFTEME